MKIKTKYAKIMATIAVAFSFALVWTSQADAYSVNTTYQLAGNQGDMRVAKPHVIITHDVGNPKTLGLNNAIFMNRTFNSAYTHFVIDGNTAYQVGTPGYVAWGAGSWANENSPAQIEIDNSYDPAHFAKSYKTYIDLIRDMAKKYGIDLTLDSSNMYAGVKTHAWVTANIWGDHMDPYDYLARMGVSKAKFANDIKNGTGSVTTPGKPEITNPVAPVKPSTNGTFKDGQYTITKETGTFYPDRALSIFEYPGISNTGVKYYKGESVKYVGYVRNGGYLYVTYHPAFNERLTYYVACRDNGEALGKFK
ncbi:peptidoglycan recognition protein family protein [Dellaglioa algida]|uniref:peptidoglycan recognition protein family protein n=1 Tax=Dellaglioa algida TaxID=105612 RepID=UPI0024C4BADB|nr:peptidoglycan recognition family protein [Dellaglioa algida]MDK1716644.1 peptidoglycan recognition protein family protein [Dellaglioa algida]MDK1721586.1 peptidoglycan recognition protein family protein [Dellaglioa algida]